MGNDITRREALKRTAAVSAIGSVGIAGCLDENGAAGADDTLTIGAI